MLNEVNYTSTNLPINLNDAEIFSSPGYTSSSIFVRDNNEISGIKVYVDLEHTYVSDISIFLISPDGTSYSLAENLGYDTDYESGDNFTNTVFDQNAITSINNSLPPFTGEFKPNQSLGPLIGKSAFGNWILRIKDDFPQDSGRLLKFEIDFNLKGEIMKNSDMDSFSDIEDNCPGLYNPYQEDSDSDGLGNECDDCHNLLGDTNDDFNIDILDIIGVVNIILTGGINSTEYSQCFITDGNIDSNTAINILDVIQLINLILN